MSDYYWLSDKELKEMYGLSLNAIITSRDSYRIFSWKEPLWPCKDKKEFVRIHKNEIIEILNELKDEDDNGRKDI